MKRDKSGGMGKNLRAIIAAMSALSPSSFKSVREKSKMSEKPKFTSAEMESLQGLSKKEKKLAVIELQRKHRNYAKNTEGWNK